MRRLIVLASAAIAASVWLLPAPSAGAVDTPPQTGCPASYELFVVADLQATQLGYTLPTDIDAAGNNNGLICGKPLSANAQKQFCNNFVGGCPVDIVYYWRDDNLVPG